MRARSFESRFDERRSVLREMRENFRKNLRNRTGRMGRAMDDAIKMLGWRLAAAVAGVA